MKKSLAGFIVSACLVGSLAVGGPALAGTVRSHAAKNSATEMGLTPASLKSLFGVVTVRAAGYESGIVGNDVEVTLYLYPLADRAAVVKEVHLEHAKRLGGLGAGAEFSNYGGGDFQLLLSSGTHVVFIDGQLLPSQGKLIALAHIIYRALK
jgi:hypothetical protein